MKKQRGMSQAVHMDNVDILIAEWRRKRSEELKIVGNPYKAGRVYHRKRGTRRWRELVFILNFPD